VSQEVVDKAAEVFPKMFDAKKVIAKMKESGSPVRTMTRDQVKKMFQDRHIYLEELLKDLRKK
jgi:tripartite-type tricarboxylate transporter receptor subunit TctC